MGFLFQPHHQNCCLHRSPVISMWSNLFTSSKSAPYLILGFPERSVGKQLICDAGDPSSIPGLGRSPGEGIGYPLQYSWASLVTQLVKNPPAVWETWAQSLGWEVPLEKGMATHSNILAWRIPWTTVHGVAKSWT